MGETIEISSILRDVESAAREHGWSLSVFYESGGFPLFALTRLASLAASHPRNVYLSTGIHGDEPAGPMAALRLLRENQWPPDLNLWFCPCLNPIAFVLNHRENADGKDLNRDYRHSETAEVRAHIAWLEAQPPFDLYLCLHEDWESHGFYLYEQNPDNQPSLAESIIKSVASICPVDPSENIEGREASGGIIRPNLDPNARPLWAEAFYLIVHKARLGYTLEAPSDFPMEVRVNALCKSANTALRHFAELNQPRVDG